MSAIFILWLRELKRYVRSRAQIIASLGQPILYLLTFGFGFGAVFQRAGLGSSVQFVAPGVIGMSMLFSSVFSGIGLLWALADEESLTWQDHMSNTFPTFRTQETNFVRKR